MGIIIALLIFSVIVIIHEFGHFIVAKKNGIYVEEFSVGMGFRILSFKKGETRYSWKLFPVGGSCIMPGEDEDVDDERSFGKKSVWARIAVIAAGPIFNFILALILSVIVIACVGTDPATVLYCEEGSAAYEAGLREGDNIVEYNGSHINIGREIYLEQYINPVDGSEVEITYERDGEKHTISVLPDKTTTYMIGINYYISDDPAEITEVTEGSAIADAGAEAGDVITSINGVEVISGTALEEYFEGYTVDGSDIQMTLERDGEQIDITVTPREITTYSLGFSYNLYREKQGVLGTLKYSLYEVKYVIKMVVKSLVMLVTGQVSADKVSGPVGIVNVIGSTYEGTKDDGGFWTIMSMLNISIMLSANLGVINLLPIPALDGGRLVFLIVEAVRRKPVPKEKEGMVHFIGFALLMILMVFLFVNDLVKIFG